MIDRTTKLLLLAIAIGLWMNVGSQWLRPVSVHAAVEQLQSYDLRDIESSLSNVVPDCRGMAYCGGQDSTDRRRGSFDS
jgi:hypothetical protein